MQMQMPNHHHPKAGLQKPQQLREQLPRTTSGRGLEWPLFRTTSKQEKAWEFAAVVEAARNEIQQRSQSKSHGVQPIVTKEAFLSGRHGQTAFAGKPTPEVEGGAVILSVKQQRSTCVHALVMNCRGMQDLSCPCRAGTLNTCPPLLSSLIKDGAEHSSTTASHSSTSPSSELRSITGSRPAEPPPAQDWVTAPTNARDLLLQLECLPLPASQLPVRKAGWMLHCCWDRGGLCQHRSPRETVTTTQTCCGRGCVKSCPEPFSQKRPGRLNEMGQKNQRYN